MVSANSAKVLVIDDDKGVTTSLSLLLKQSGYSPSTAKSPAEALSYLAENDVDLILQDMNFSRRTDGTEGLQLLENILSSNPSIPIILMTAWGSVPLAVEGMKKGASDFITKPWTNEQILHSVENAFELGRARKGFAVLANENRSKLEKDYNISSFIGEDPEFLKTIGIAVKVSTTNAPILITGESGTGKEVLAELIWLNSNRKQDPFVKVNLGGIPSTLFESEMFGHVKGAFTDAKHARTGRFEAADNGTIFLDEIGDLDESCQVKLLRVLQDRTYEKVGSSESRTIDTRIISATNRDLPELISESRFREDLFYRINLITVHIPPLRDRQTDIPILANHFLKQISTTYNRPEMEITPAALDYLAQQKWPGNVRQFKQLIERTVLLSHSDRLDSDSFMVATEMELPQKSSFQLPAPGTKTLEEIEKMVILDALSYYNSNMSKVADALGLSRSALYRRLEKHGIDE